MTALGSGPSRGQGDPRALALALGVMFAASALATWFFVTRTSLPTLGLYLVPLATLTATGVLLAFYAPRNAAEQAPPRAAWPGRLAGILFFVAFAAALLSLRGQDVEKPPLFYLFYALAASALTVRALVGQTRTIDLAASIVGSVALIGLFAVATHGATPTNFGADTAFHRKAALALLETGSVGAIVAPYRSFAAFQAIVAAFAHAGLSLKWAVIATDITVTAATCVAVAMIVQRAFGTRSAMIAAGLLSMAGTVVGMAATLSPSKAGMWTVIFLAFLLAEGSTLAALAALGIAFAGFLYHPVIAMAAVLIMSAYFVAFTLARVDRWLPPLARLAGFPWTKAPHRLLADPVSVPAILGIVIVAAGWIAAREPNLVKAIVGIFLFQGDQSGAIGTVQVSALSWGFLSETLLVNLAGMALLVPAFLVVVRIFSTPAGRESTLLVTMLVAVLGFLGLLTLGGLFLIGPARFLILQDVLLVGVGAAGLALWGDRIRSRRTWIGVVALVLVFSLANVTSYRIDGNDLASPAIPKQTDHTSWELLAMVDALRPHLTTNDSMVFDNYAAKASGFPSHSEATFYNDPVPRFSMTTLGSSLPPPGTLFAWDEPATSRVHDAPRWRALSAANDLLYDNGKLRAGRFVPDQDSAPGSSST